MFEIFLLHSTYILFFLLCQTEFSMPMWAMEFLFEHGLLEILVTLSLLFLVGRYLYSFSQDTSWVIMFSSSYILNDQYKKIYEIIMLLGRQWPRKLKSTLCTSHFLMWGPQRRYKYKENGKVKQNAIQVLLRNDLNSNIAAIKSLGQSTRFKLKKASLILFQPKPKYDHFTTFEPRHIR